MLRECSRQPLGYRLEALPSLGKFLSSFSLDKHFLKVYETLRPCIEGTAKALGESDDDDDDGESKQKSNAPAMGMKEDLKAAALDVLSQSWPRDMEYLVIYIYIYIKSRAGISADMCKKRMMYIKYNIM